MYCQVQLTVAADPSVFVLSRHVPVGGFSDVDVAVVVSGGGGGVDDVAAVSDGDGRDGGGEGGRAGRVRGEPPASGIAEPVGVRGRGYCALARMSPFGSSPAESMSGRRYCSSSSSSANRLRLCCSMYWIVVACLTRMLSYAWVGLWLG